MLFFKQFHLKKVLSVNLCLSPENINSLTQICFCGNNFAYIGKTMSMYFWQSTAKVYFENTRAICITYIHVKVYSRGTGMVFFNCRLQLCKWHTLFTTILHEKKTLIHQTSNIIQLIVEMCPVDKSIPHYPRLNSQLCSAILQLIIVI